MSGIGRSTLVSVITEHLEREVTRPGEALAYIFTTYGVVFSVLDIILSICKQLAAQCSQLPWQLVKMYSQMAQAGSHPDIDELMLLIVSMCDSLSRVFILIDDLSELPRDSDRSILIPKLQWLRNHWAKILVSSWIHGDRPEPCGCTRDIEGAFAGEAELLLLPYEGDMRAFISNEMHKNGEWETWLSNTGTKWEDIVNHVLEDAVGVYPVAELLVQRELRTRKEMAPIISQQANPWMSSDEVDDF